MGRPCRCCKPTSRLPDTPYGRCPCTPWEITSNFSRHTFAYYDNCWQEWWCLSDGKENGMESVVNDCGEAGRRAIVDYHDPDACDVSGELQEYAGYVKFPPAPWCVKKPDDPSSLNMDVCIPGSIVISKIIHIGVPAKVNISLHADTSAGECETTERSDSASYDAEPGWYEIAYSFTEYRPFKPRFHQQSRAEKYDTPTATHSAYIRKFVKTDYKDPDKERPKLHPDGFGIRYPDDATGHYWKTPFANPADEEPAADKIVCCSQYECGKIGDQKKGTLYGTSPLSSELVSWEGLPQSKFYVEWGAKSWDDFPFGDDNPEWDIPDIYMKAPLTEAFGLEVTKDRNFVGEGYPYVCSRLETFSAITHFDGGYSGESSIAAFEFTFTPAGEPDIWPEGGEDHKKALKIITDDPKLTCKPFNDPEWGHWGGGATYEDMKRELEGDRDYLGFTLEQLQEFFGDGSDDWAPPAWAYIYADLAKRLLVRLEKLSDEGCVCFSGIKAFGTSRERGGNIREVECVHIGCRLGQKDLRTVWEYNPDEAKKAGCQKPSNEVIDCEQHFVDTTVGRFPLDDEGTKHHDFDGEWVIVSPVLLRNSLWDFDDGQGTGNIGGFRAASKWCIDLGYDGVYRGMPPCGRGAWKFCYNEGCY